MFAHVKCFMKSYNFRERSLFTKGGGWCKSENGLHSKTRPLPLEVTNGWLETLSLGIRIHLIFRPPNRNQLKKLKSASIYYFFWNLFMAWNWNQFHFFGSEPESISFLSTPVLMHGGLICIAFCPSVRL